MPVQSTQSNLDFVPRLVLNSRGVKVSTTLKSELRKCDAFQLYVAFVNPGGLQVLKQELLDCEQRGVPGQVLVSQYLNFTHPLALEDLLKFKNLDVRIDTQSSMHAKGYFFQSGDQKHVVIGSSNWTQSALSQNQELNVWCSTPIGSGLDQEVQETFRHAFQQAVPVTPDYLEWYKGVWKPVRVEEKGPQYAVQDVAQPVWAKPSTRPADSNLPVPNAMQEEGLAALDELVELGERKALVVSATGTGKTYLAAFFVRNLKAKRVLFVVHRERIARQAMESFRHVLGDHLSYGVYIGSESDTSSDILFSTVQTLSRPERLARFGEDDFDCVIVDESHRAGANSYRRFLDHFNPGFLLGMTATPERTDGLDIFPLFDHNVAFEIRLQRALNEDMLCPFHYFGVSDLTVDGEVVDDRSDFNKLTAEARVDHILDRIDRYGSCSERVRGLIFCSRNEEAAQLSGMLNRRGLRTMALSGADGEEAREQAIALLESAPDDPFGLDYILTVDIFNEGVDIPSVNQVVMLRPTQSAIVFVQQLGRGLRKVEGQDKFLTVIDFIGNYERNFLIPAALYGDTTWNKDKLRRLMISGNDTLPGASTVNFDLITKERIFESIDQARNMLQRDLKAEYKAMQSRLGRHPRMMDWQRLGGRDPRLFGKALKGSYAEFGRLMGDEGALAISEPMLEALSVWSKDGLNGSSIEEAVLMAGVLANSSARWDDLLEELETLGFPSTKNRLESAARSMNLQFMRTNVNGELVPFSEKWGDRWLLWDVDEVRRGPQLEAVDWARDMSEFVKHRFTHEFSHEDWRDGFVIGGKYTRADVFRILGLEFNPVAQNVGGYMIDAGTHSCPIFVTYHKSEDISESTQYEDHFIDPLTLHYFSKSNRSMKSNDIQFFLRAARGSGARMPLFVKKSDDEGIDFYYLGELTPLVDSFQEDRMASKGGKPGPKVVRMDMRLSDPVPADLYQYLQEY